jgi:hypothetical protein
LAVVGSGAADVVTVDADLADFFAVFEAVPPAVRGFALVAGFLRVRWAIAVALSPVDLADGDLVDRDGFFFFWGTATAADSGVAA